MHTGFYGNDPFGSRSKPGFHVPASNLCRSSGEIPEGRAVLVPSLCAYARQRTLEPVLEPGVTPLPHSTDRSTDITSFRSLRRWRRERAGMG